jgi:hypothetical protein
MRRALFGCALLVACSSSDRPPPPPVKLPHVTVYPEREWRPAVECANGTTVEQVEVEKAYASWCLDEHGRTQGRYAIWARTDGRVLQEREYVDDRPHGAWKMFRDDETASETAEFVDGKLVSMNSQPVTPGTERRSGARLVMMFHNDATLMWGVPDTVALYVEEQPEAKPPVESKLVIEARRERRLAIASGMDAIKPDVELCGINHAKVRPIRIDARVAIGGDGKPSRVRTTLERDDERELAECVEELLRTLDLPTAANTTITYPFIL